MIQFDTTPNSIIETFRLERLRERNLTYCLIVYLPFAYFKKKRHPKRLHGTFFHQKVSTVTVISERSRSQNAITSNI